jgi:hypothetical protein
VVLDGARAEPGFRPTASSSSSSTTPLSSTGNTPSGARSSPGMENVDKIKRGEPVQNPDKIVKATIAADA